MTKCPRCGHFTVAYDSYRKITRCYIDGCSCVINKDGSYNYLKIDAKNETTYDINVKGGQETVIRFHRWDNMMFSEIYPERFYLSTIWEYV